MNATAGMNREGDDALRGFVARGEASRGCTQPASRGCTQPSLPAGVEQRTVEARAVCGERPDLHSIPLSGGEARSQRPSPHLELSVEQRLEEWRPSMVDYRTHPSISSGFLRRAEDGLSSAVYKRLQPELINTDPRMAKGCFMHALIQDHDVDKIAVASRDVEVRRGKKWDRELAKAACRGCTSIVLARERDALAGAWSSLMDPPAGWDTKAKQEIRCVLKHWSPRVAEVSHKWSPVPGCWCRTREDIVARSPCGVWTAIQIKTTETPPARWWPYWRRYVRQSSSFYRASHKDLFREPFKHLLMIARTVPPYQWMFLDLEEFDEELDALWADDIVPSLREITATLARGENHGPEERGLQL